MIIQGLITKNRQQGFSLFEVLIALLVLSVGLLGLANLQGQSISSSYNAHLRTQATSLAQSMVDRMRANRSHALQATNNYQTAIDAQPPTTSVNCLTATCSEEEIALFDVREWKCNLGLYAEETVCNGFVNQSTLPNGVGSVTAPDVTTGLTTVTVQWVDTDGEQHQVRMFTGL